MHRPITMDFNCLHFRDMIHRKSYRTRKYNIGCKYCHLPVFSFPLFSGTWCDGIVPCFNAFWELKDTTPCQTKMIPTIRVGNLTPNWQVMPMNCFHCRTDTYSDITTQCVINSLHWIIFKRQKLFACVTGNVEAIEVRYHLSVFNPREESIKCSGRSGFILYLLLCKISCLRY